MEKRKIQTSRNLDILRWGYCMSGTFTIKKAYRLHTSQHTNQRRDIWKHIWHSNLWPKVTFFLSKILHHSILTWDNLQKRGFEGPRYCCLCGQHPETMQHLLINCAFTTHLWNVAANNFQRTNLDQDFVTNTIENWTQNPYQNNILNEYGSSPHASYYGTLGRNETTGSSAKPVNRLNKTLGCHRPPIQPTGAENTNNMESNH